MPLVWQSFGGYIPDVRGKTSAETWAKDTTWMFLHLGNRDATVFVGDVKNPSCWLVWSGVMLCYFYICENHPGYGRVSLFFDIPHHATNRSDGLHEYSTKLTPPLPRSPHISSQLHCQESSLQIWWLLGLLSLPVRLQWEVITMVISFSVSSSWHEQFDWCICYLYLYI